MGKDVHQKKNSVFSISLHCCYSIENIKDIFLWNEIKTTHESICPTYRSLLHFIWSSLSRMLSSFSRCIARHSRKSLKRISLESKMNSFWSTRSKFGNFSSGSPTSMNSSFKTHVIVQVSSQTPVSVILRWIAHQYYLRGLTYLFVSPSGKFPWGALDNSFLSPHFYISAWSGLKEMVVLSPAFSAIQLWQEKTSLMNCPLFLSFSQGTWGVTRSGHRWNIHRLYVPDKSSFQVSLISGLAFDVRCWPGNMK